jgi:hypothetical protein
MSRPTLKGEEVAPDGKYTPAMSPLSLMAFSQVSPPDMGSIVL